jgi:AraC-like DNA-binding protein
MPDRARQSWIDCRTLCNGIERAEVRLHDCSFSPHRHDTYAIGYTLSGVQSFDYRGETHHSRPGDVFVLHPDELHDGRAGTPSGFGYRILYVSPGLIGEAMPDASLPFAHQAVSANSRLKSIVASAFAEPASTDMEIRDADFVSALADTLRDASDLPRKRRKSPDAKAMGRIRDDLMASLADGVDVSELERRHGIDRYALSRLFRRCYGVGPHRFMILRRLDLAKKHIRNGSALAEAALAAGFADQSHMTRSFRNAYGIPPGRWKSMLVA